MYFLRNCNCCHHEWQKTSLVTSQHWFRLWLGVVREQAINWANVDLYLCRHMVSLDHNYCTHCKLMTPYYAVNFCKRCSMFWLVAAMFFMGLWICPRNYVSANKQLVPRMYHWFRIEVSWVQRQFLDLAGIKVFKQHQADSGCFIRWRRIRVL